MRLTAAVLVTFLLILTFGGDFVFPLVVVVLISHVPGALEAAAAAVVGGLLLVGSNMIIAARPRLVVGVGGLLGLVAAPIVFDLGGEINVWWWGTAPFLGFALWHALHLVACLQE